MVDRIGIGSCQIGHRVDCLRSRRSERFLRSPGDHDKPNDPRQDEDIAGQDYERVGSREALGTEHPALHDVGQTGQPHQVANGSWQPRRQDHRAAEQDQAETKHEALITSGAPLQPPNRLSASEAGRLLRLRRAHPSINGLFERDPVHSLQDAVEPKRYRRRDSSQSCHPGRASSPEVKSEVEDEKSGDDHRHANELAEMHGGPAGAAGIYGKHRSVVVGRPAGMEEPHHHIKDEAHYKQHCREAKRVAVDHEPLPAPRPWSPVTPASAGALARWWAAIWLARYAASWLTKPSRAEPRVCCQDKPRKYRPGISVTPRRCATCPRSTAAGMWIQV